MEASGETWVTEAGLSLQRAVRVKRGQARAVQLKRLSSLALPTLPTWAAVTQEGVKRVMPDIERSAPHDHFRREPVTGGVAHAAGVAFAPHGHCRARPALPPAQGCWLRPSPDSSCWDSTSGWEGAGAATDLGSTDPGAAPDSFICAGCGPEVNIGFRQFALRGPRSRLRKRGCSSRLGRTPDGSPGPRSRGLWCLRPAARVGAAVVASAPLPVTSPGGALHEVTDLHLPVEFGDVLGFVFRTGHVDLGIRRVPRPDGAPGLLRVAVPALRRGRRNRD